MLTRLLIIYFLLIYTVNANANEDNQQVVQKKIILPWSDYTDMFTSHLEKKLSFSKQQIKKENRIHKQYEEYYSEHNSPADFSMQFLEKKSDAKGVKTLISGFLKFCEDNFQTSKSKSDSLNYHIKKQQDQWLNGMKNENYKMHRLYEHEPNNRQK